MRLAQLALLVLAAALAACAGSPPGPKVIQRVQFDPTADPYWTNPVWQKSLFDAVQAAVHDPVDADDMSTPGIHATVSFTYLQGNIQYPDIVTSTGDPKLDRVLIQQLAAAQVPQPAAGIQTDTAHQFVMDLDMPTPLETFETTIYSAIDGVKVYPKDPIIRGATGNTRVTFDYQDGKASDIVMTGSSRDKELDQASLGAVARASMPPAPALYSGILLHIEVLFCYSLAKSWNDIKNPCPNARNIILVQGTRIVRYGF